MGVNSIVEGTASGDKHLSEESKPSDEQKEIEALNKRIADLMEDAKTNFYWNMIKSWLIGVALICAAILLSFLMSLFFPLPLPVMSITQSRLNEVVGDIFAATVTINGLIIGFTPVTSFFFVGEIRELFRSREQELKSEKEKSGVEARKLSDKIENLDYIISNNVQSGILKYATTFIGVSILLELFLVELYFILEVGIVTTGTFLFLVADFVIFSVIIFGMFPLINTALYRPAFRPVSYLVVEKEVVRFELE